MQRPFATACCTASSCFVSMQLKMFFSTNKRVESTSVELPSTAPIATQAASFTIALSSFNKFTIVSDNTLEKMVLSISCPIDLENIRRQMHAIPCLVSGEQLDRLEDLSRTYSWRVVFASSAPRSSHAYPMTLAALS